ncbi:thioesterase family protein [Aliidiomarina maris]|uniref:Thioesterase n=1 Tax=Aliidiomarina maris TaxID=531312 RepID=A0A327X3X5_9GAMM|nr:thioesterase family protein [Aliidiomarina maris]MCL5050354.1 thioesterase family protein [Bacillota bacterium]RAK01667.1 thioesterase superfamily protein [Aliidiomarina maris]RUO28489.1 thioesterase [Aliidiomarina maris]
MNLLLRMVWILIRRFRQPQCHPLDSLRVRSRALPNDLDFNMHVNNGRYLSFADLGRVDWFVRTGCLQVARKHKAIPVIGDANARFIRQLKAFDPFEVETQLLGWNHKWAFLQHKIYDGQNRLAAIVVVRGMFWRKQGGMTPDSLLEATGHGHLSSPELPEWVAHWSQTLDELTAAAKAGEVT